MSTYLLNPLLKRKENITMNMFPKTEDTVLIVHETRILLTNVIFSMDSNSNISISVMPTNSRNVCIILFSYLVHSGITRNVFIIDKMYDMYGNLSVLSINTYVYAPNL